MSGRRPPEAETSIGLAWAGTTRNDCEIVTEDTVSKPARPSCGGQPGHEGLDILPCVKQLGAAAKVVEFLGEGNDIASQALHLTERLLLDGWRIDGCDVLRGPVGASDGRDIHQTPTATRITAANAPAMAGLNHQDRAKAPP